MLYEEIIDSLLGANNWNRSLYSEGISIKASSEDEYGDDREDDPYKDDDNQCDCPDDEEWDEPTREDDDYER